MAVPPESGTSGVSSHFTGFSSPLPLEGPVGFLSLIVKSALAVIFFRFYK